MNGTYTVSFANHHDFGEVTFQTRSSPSLTAKEHIITQTTLEALASDVFRIAVATFFW